MRVQVRGVNVPVDKQDDPVEVLARIGKVARDSLGSARVVQRAIDARQHNLIVYFSYRIEVEVDPGIIAKLKEHFDVVEVRVVEASPSFKPRLKPLDIGIVGMGPAGLFAALQLSRSSHRVTIYERGPRIEERAGKVGGFWRGDPLDSNANVCFGEGGAGTFSDGKLTCRKRDTDQFFRLIGELGIPDKLLSEKRPHLGSDGIRDLVKKIVGKLSSRCTLRYNTAIDDIIVDHDRVVGLRTKNGERIVHDKIVFATGHSARDIYELFARHNIAMVAKGTAIGVRVEMSQEAIDRQQYGRFACLLPPAELFLTYTYKGERGQRGVYSFCMCPGGRVIAASSAQNEVVTNGMSDSQRAEPTGNAAIVVGLHTGDFGDGGNPLAGIAYQREIEHRMFFSSKRPYHAPAQFLDDFLAGRISDRPVRSSYRPGISSTNLRRLLPPIISEPLSAALAEWKGRYPLLFTDAVLIGAETRTSSPVRILRHPLTFVSISHQDLYPIGEGSGYSGGIVSSAIDGLRLAGMF